MWVVPGISRLCLLSQQEPARSIFALSCASSRQAIAHGIATTFLSAGNSPGSKLVRRVIVGLAPDGTKEIVAHAPRSAVVIPVINGVFFHKDDLLEAPDGFTLAHLGGGDPAASDGSRR